LYNYYHEIPTRRGVKWGVFMKGTNFILSTETGIVCMMEVDKRKAKYTSDYEGQIHYSLSLSVKNEYIRKSGECINLYGPGR
jgi:YHS domain-containing protein